MPETPPVQKPKETANKAPLPNIELGIPPLGQERGQYLEKLIKRRGFKKGDRIRLIAEIDSYLTVAGGFTDKAGEVVYFESYDSKTKTLKIKTAGGIKTLDLTKENIVSVFKSNKVSYLKNWISAQNGALTPVEYLVDIGIKSGKSRMKAPTVPYRQVFFATSKGMTAGLAEMLKKKFEGNSAFSSGEHIKDGEKPWIHYATVVGDVVSITEAGVTLRISKPESKDTFEILIPWEFKVGWTTFYIDGRNGFTDDDKPAEVPKGTERDAITAWHKSLYAKVEAPKSAEQKPATEGEQGAKIAIPQEGTQLQ